MMVLAVADDTELTPLHASISSGFQELGIGWES